MDTHEIVERHKYFMSEITGYIEEIRGCIHNKRPPMTEHVELMRIMAGFKDIENLYKYAHRTENNILSLEADYEQAVFEYERYKESKNT